MRHIQKYAVFTVVLLHIPMLLVFLHGDERWEYILTVLAAFFGDISLSFWQLEIMTATHGKTGDFVRAYLPYFLDKCVIVGAELLFMFVNNDGIFFGGGLNYALWWLFAAGTAALAALVTFVTGAARTMLYHDEKGK